MCEVENEDVVGAAPAGDAPTASEWSTILLPTNVWLILQSFDGIPLQFITNKDIIIITIILTITLSLNISSNSVWHHFTSERKKVIQYSLFVERVNSYPVI